MMKMMRQTQSQSPIDRTVRFLILSMLIVLVGGLLTLFWQEHQRQTSQAAGDVIVGPPSLSAAAVDAIFTRLGSPMAGTGQTVLAASRRTHIDDAFALGVWWAETNDGMAGVGVGNHNPGGVQGSPNYPSNGYAFYPSYADAEIDWFNIVQSRYTSQGLTSVYTICYPYVGTSGALNWANKVMNYMSSYRASSPPPPPAVIQKPIPTAAVIIKPKVNKSSNIAITPLKKAQQQKTLQSAALPKGNIKVVSIQNVGIPQSTQIVLLGLGLMVALLLAVPGLLIRRKQQATGSIGHTEAQPVSNSLSGLTLQDQATQGLPITTALGAGIEAISTQQIKALYTNQFSPVLEGALANVSAKNPVNTNQLAFEFDVHPLPTIPASPLFMPHTLQPVAMAAGNGVATVPPTPLQRIPVTPLLQRIPATPVLPRGSQGGLLTRYNMQSKPRRIALTRSSGNTDSHKIVPHYQESAAEPQLHSQTETLLWH